nr:reverse transcriptase domain-containing protein [Tanacetum cinerariifolium]
MTVPTPITPINRTNTNTDQDGPPDLQDQILSHISYLKALVQKHNESPTGLLKPIQLSFDNEGGPEKEHDEEFEDLRKPYKEVLKSLFSRRIIEFSAPKHRTPTNLKIYDGSTYPDDHITRFVGAANQGEWEMPIWCRMFQQTLDRPARGWFDRLPNGCIDNCTDLHEAFVERFALRRKCCKDPTEVAKIVRRANETLPNFKECWTEEMSYIPNVPIIMQISAFMSNSKCPELARRFSDQVPQTLAEMMRMVDDFLKSEEVFKNTELPKREHSERPAVAQFRGSRPLRHSYGNRPSRADIYRRGDHYQPYVTPRAPNGRYDNRRREVNHLRLDSLTKISSEILAIELQLRLLPCPPTVAPKKKENLDRQRRGNRGRQTGSNNGQRKVINMVRQSNNGLNRKSLYKQFEEWMDVPITLLPVSTDDVSDGPLIVEAEVEGYWIRRVFVDQRAAMQVRTRGNGRRNGRDKELKHGRRRKAQKRRVLGIEKSKVVTREVEEWVKAGIVRLMKYPTWILNPVLVKKADDTWRMCIDFKNLNLACPKDYYPLPEFDLKIKVVMGHPFKCFLDAYKGYHQIQMATYQRLIDSAFQTQLGGNLEAYVDDMPDPPRSRTKLCPFGETSTMPTSPVSKAMTILRGSLAKGHHGSTHQTNTQQTRSIREARQEHDTLRHAIQWEKKIRRDGLCIRIDNQTRKDTNNEAEYKARLVGLRIARKMKVQTLDVQVYSKLVACQMNGEFVASNEGMTKYLPKAKEQATLFKKFSIKNIPRNQNQKVDVLSKLASVFQPSDEGDTSQSIKLKVRGCSGGSLQANYIIREVHEGAYGMHAGARSVVAKIMRQGYYWPTMHGDTKEVVDKCNSCQIHAPVPKLPKTRLTSIMSPWTFYQGGLDILGPLPEGPDKLKFIIVEIYYFTKWIEA